MYIYDNEQWPDFSWNRAQLAELLASVRHQQGLLLGHMQSLGFRLKEEANLQALTQEIIKSSEIEGEKVDAQQVRSSIARRLGIDIGALPPADRYTEGMVEVMLDATHHFDHPLTAERIQAWHAALFPTGRSGLQRIQVGQWRTAASGPMQVVSGAYGREKVHYEAPDHTRVPTEMTRFIHWLSQNHHIDPVIQSAIAHFWFVTIHPFEDGNGRIARAIADLMLARAEQTPQRFYSMSAQIQRERHAYYTMLERCQKGSLDITAWLEWYLTCLQRAITAAHDMLYVILTKARFWTTHQGEPFNARQQLVINKLLDGFYGKLTSSKWAKLTKCSQDTALRDINELLQRNILIKEQAGGRSTSYKLINDN